MQIKAARSSVRARPPLGKGLVLVAKVESAPTSRQEEVLWPWCGSRKQCQVGLTSFGAVCFSEIRFVRRFKRSAKATALSLTSP